MGFSLLSRFAGPTLALSLFLSLTTNTLSWQSPTKQSPKSQPLDALAESSRKAIIETGISEKYFRDHFTLLQSINKAGDTRVVWKYSLNGYQVTINDAVGYYTKDHTRVYLHSIKNMLGSTRDIAKTIPRARAARLMKACIGSYTGENILFLRLDQKKSASFYMSANAVTPAQRGKGNQDTERDREKTSSHPQQVDTEREEEEGGNRPPLTLGYINLETGKCTKGKAGIAPFMR
jgi:hypothetical protein